MEESSAAFNSLSRTAASRLVVAMATPSCVPISMKEKVLVTGASGFVGSAVARKLVEAGYSVRALVRGKSPRTHLAGLDLDFFEGDLRDRKSIESATAGMRYIFHVAADYRLWARDPSEIFASNVEGTRNVMEEAMRAGVERVIYTSSVATIALQSNGMAADETIRLHAACVTTDGPAEAEACGVLKIDLTAVVSNWEKLARYAAAECAAVVKGNAYGCGIEPIAGALAKTGCSTFFVSDIPEAKRVRSVAPNASIYVLRGLYSGTGQAFAEINARPVIYSSIEMAEWDLFVSSQRWAGGCALHAVFVGAGEQRWRHGKAERSDTVNFSGCKRLPMNFRESQRNISIATSIKCWTMTDGREHMRTGGWWAFASQMTLRSA